MKLLYTTVVLVLTLKSSFSARVVCYYDSWSVYNGGNGLKPEDIDPNLCTHVNYAFATLNADGSLSSQDENADVTQGGFKRTTDLKNRNPNVKVLLSVGPSSHWSEVAANPGKRAAMVGSSRWFVETYNFDGIDLDWEVPQSADNGNYIALLQEFRNDFNRNGWLVSAAVSANPQAGYNVPEVSRLLDYINVMTYDMYGPDWSQYTGQNSPLYASSIESDWEKNNLNMAVSIQNWINAGADPKKLNAGIAFYGHTYTLADPNNHGLHAPFTGRGRGDGALPYFEICSSSWNCVWDDEQKNPICVQGDQWLGSDNVQSVTEKAKWIKSKGIGGAMVWALGQDNNSGSCGTVKPLLHAVHDNLN